LVQRGEKRGEGGEGRRMEQKEEEGKEESEEEKRRGETEAIVGRKVRGRHKRVGRREGEVG